MKGLDRIFSSGKFSTNKEDLLCYGYDASGLDVAPAAVVWPESAEDVVRIARFAYAGDHKLIPRGAGTGMTGGSVGVRNAILVSFERMNRIVEIDTRNLNVVVEPGVVNGALQRELEAQGFFYPPDPASLNTCTIGGNVAENAGGPRAVKYGVTRDYVMSLEAVLADGTPITTGVRTRKGVVGYDLTRLLTGSEGTLAMITKIRLKVLPAPEGVLTVLSFFNSVESAGKCVSGIMASGIIPRTLEIMDALTISAVNRYKNVGLSESAEAVLLIELDGHLNAIKEEAAKTADVCRKFGGDVKMATSTADRELLWSGRRAVSPALYRLSPTKISEDVVVPISRVAEALAGLKKLSQKSGIPIAGFGHAGDGNLHVNILCDRKNPEEFSKAETLVRELFELTLSLGGTISGEHGIGLTKAKYLDMELDPTMIDLMRGIKRLFDHKGILNPGKVFEL
jgi:glycolate oxidase